MKTLEKLYEEIQADSDLKKKYVKAAEDNKVIDFLRAHDCETTEAELEAFISSKKKKELGDDELDMVSGGGACTTYTDDGWPIVTAFNTCSHYLASNGGVGICVDCLHSETVGVNIVCYCKQRHESVDDI